ncbi:hypothetical protein OWV82_014922 [Melia azedarach]|uniref:Uncharacterized protein n=1 Tax=Melia azedarach TaxID=155640 RepID=A0ACC1XMV4_MELAZ|nr:hypothetical protein OWV82_014922 [Melia azedarach]
MDYNDNELQSQNLQLAGEGNAKFSPVLRPYALPKFDFDDSLHGHLRFDSLVETEVFLGIESNEDNQWIEEYSRGSSGIQFRTSAAESCSISRHNNVWSEATSSESVEMLLKSVGQEENIPGKTIMRESDACDELGCIIKQMEPVTKHDDKNFIKGGDVQPILPDEILGNFSGLKEDVGGTQPLVDVTFQKNECESSLDCGLSDPISDAVSGKGNLPLSKESNDVDQRKVDTSLESPNSKAEENSTASGTQFDSVATSALNISSSSGELNMQDAPHKKNGISENLEVLTTEIGEQGEERHLVLEAETNYQNSEGNAVDSRATQLENPLCLASKMESLEEENKVEASTATAGDSSNMLKEDTVLHIIEECNENVQDAKCVNQVPSKDFEIADTSEVNVHETSPVSFERDKSFERLGVEVSNANDSEASLLPLDENKVSKGEAVTSSASHGGSVSTSNVESSVAEPLSKTPMTLTSEGVNDDSGVCREDSNAEVNVSSFILGDSSDENVVSKQNDGNSISADVTESTRLPSDCSSMDHVVGGGLIMDKGVSCLSLGEGSSKNELIVSKSHSDAITGNESAMKIASLVSHDATEGVILPSEPVAAANAAITHQEVKMMNAYNEESHGEAQGVVRNLVSQESLNEMDPCTVVSDSKKLIHGAEARFLSEKHEEMTMKENHEKTASKDSDADSLPKDGKMSALPLSVPSQEVQCDADQKVQEDEMLISGDKISGQVAVPHIDGDTLKIREGSISSTPLSESEFRPVECGSSCTNLDKSTCGSPTVIRDTELSQSENEKKGVNESRGQNNNPVQSVSPDSKGNDVSKDEKTFTFEVSPIKDSSEREGGKNWKPFSAMKATTTSLTVEGSPATSSVGQLNSKSSQDASRGNPQVSDREIVRSGSKSTSERKPRRAPSKAAGKESAKKGNSTKDTTSGRPSEKGDRTSNVSLSPAGICQLVQSNEMQHYGHVDGSTMKPFLLSTSASTLPDLNTSSSMFQQPFTDLQQVQLRAQIFVYGALIQGTAPDEAYMISAFGGPDGGRSIWETSWRACTERLHGQKSVPNNAETPLQSRSGKVASSPLGRAISMGTPSPIVNPMIPLSSPLWSIPTPSADTLQSSGMPRSAVMDYQQALSPLHPQQTPPIRSFVGHNASWISQAPFRGTWVASPQTSGFDGSVRFPVVPNTETVQLTPAKEPSVPHSSAVKHISSGPMIQGISPATVFPGTSSMLDPRKVTVSPIHHSTDPKPRKRKKVPVSENIGQIKLHSQSQTEPVSAPIVNSLMSTSVTITTPSSLLSKASTEKVIMPMSPAMSADLPRGKREAQQRASLSEETLTKLKEAKTQAEDAAAFAAAAVGHGQEIWNQLDKQKNSHLAADVEGTLASAAVTIAAAAAVAKAAAAAANVASSAALQAKLMADEALDPGGYGNSSQISGTSHSDSVKDMGKATPASILKGDSTVSGSSSIIFAAREAARRKVEAASAASKRAENMDAIVKAAELAAEAVSQAGIIVAMGDPMPLNELIEAGPEGYWKVPQASTQLVAKSNEKNNENLKMDTVGEGPGTSAKHSKEVPLDNREMETSNQGRPPTLRNMSGELFDNHGRLADRFSGSVAANGKNTKGPKGSKASDLAKTIGVVPESEIGSRSPSITIQIEQERVVEPSSENSIKEGSCVEVFKEGVRFKAGWFTANVLNLKEGKAYVCYNELISDEGSEKLKEWVALKGEGDRPPSIRMARPVTAMPFEGTRKRRRAAMGDYAWSVGDRVDAWMQDSWWEGVVTEKNKKDETLHTVHFPAQGETSAVRAWHLRPSLVWKDGEWVEWSSSAVKNSTSHEGDTPQEKRLRLGTVEAKGKDKLSKGVDIVESGKSDEPTLLDLAANEKLFNIGKSSRDENKPDTLRMIRTGLQKEGSRVVFGVPKPGKKRKFMDVSKHYVVDQVSKVSEANNSVKFAKYLMPQSQGSGSRGWKNASRSEPKEKRAAVSKPKVLKSGKPPSVPGRTILQKDNSASSAVSTPDDGTDIDHTEKIKDFARHVENTSGKNDAMESRSLSASEGATETPILFSSMPLSSDVPTKKVSTSNPRTERVTKGKLAPASGKMTRIAEDKVFNNNSTKMSEVVEPRRSNRRIQPTSRLLEGLQSSLIISKIPSVSHDKSQKGQNRSMSRGNNNG